jgi:hypothetical protein
MFNPGRIFGGAHTIDPVDLSPSEQTGEDSVVEQVPIIIRKDRRAPIPKPQAPSDGGVEDAKQRRPCWLMYSCSPEEREGCYAFRTQQNCWDIWALRQQNERHCCQRESDCRVCIIGSTKFPQKFLVHPTLGQALGQPRSEPSTVICPHLTIDGQRPLVKDLYAELSTDTPDTGPDSRPEARCLECKVRNTYLDGEYVHTMCASPHHRACIFLVR